MSGAFRGPRCPKSPSFGRVFVFGGTSFSARCSTRRTGSKFDVYRMGALPACQLPGLGVIFTKNERKHTRCLMEWRVQTVIRRCQLGSARSLLLSQDGRRLRKAFSAWREGRRGRVVTARALFRAARSIETATLRAGFRRLAVSTRRKDQEEVVSKRGGGGGGGITTGMDLCFVRRHKILGTITFRGSLFMEQLFHSRLGGRLVVWKTRCFRQQQVLTCWHVLAAMRALAGGNPPPPLS